MRKEILFSTLIITMKFYVIAASSTPKWFMECLTTTGEKYRKTVESAILETNVTTQLQAFLKNETEIIGQSRQARILIARIDFPTVFSELGKLLEEWRTAEKSEKPHGTRTGQLAGRILTFTKIKPESRYIYVSDDEAEKRYAATNRLIIKGMFKKKIEKYTEAEVQAGIARNTAARLAVLEHFLKFLGEGDAYEQSEVVDVVCLLWGRDRVRRNADLAVVDGVPDAGSLMREVFRNPARPLAVRMAAFEYADAIPVAEAQPFMFFIVTNALPESITMMGQRTISKALFSLESSGDAATLSVLKSQTNAPTWKREWIKKSVQTIEKRLSGTGERKTPDQR